MSEVTPNLNHSPMTRAQVVDAYFMEHRARLLDVAAFLDRIDRAGPGTDDFRMTAYRGAIALLLDGQPQRTRRMLELLSDPSTTPIATAHVKGATGAHDPIGKVH
jgi:acetyl-CoA acetyltransferase